MADNLLSGILPDPAPWGRIEFVMFDAISAPRSGLQPMRQRHQEPAVSAEVAASLDYQILRRTLTPDSEIRVSDAPPISGGSPATEAATSSAPAVPSATVSTAIVSDSAVQRSELNLNIGASADTQPVQKTDPLVLDLAGTTLDAADKKRLADPLVGGLILFARNFENRAQLTALTSASPWSRV